MRSEGLVADLRGHGVQLDIGDGGLICRARRGVLNCELRTVIREHKTAIEVVLEAERIRLRACAWGDLATVVEWFLTTRPPAEPFKLMEGVTITDPSRWWRALAADVAAGPDGPRARYGALQDDMWRAYRMFGPVPTPSTAQ